MILIRLLLSFISVIYARDLDKLYSKAKLQLGQEKFTAYIADDDQGREQGLMYIEKMPEDTGMLFVFTEPQPLGFWMKNTVIPLSIGFIDERTELIDVQEMKATSSLMDLHPPTYQSRGPALFALEMNSGWFSRHHVKRGLRLTLLGSTRSSLLKQQLSRAKAVSKNPPIHP